VRIERSAVGTGEEGCGGNLSFVEAGSSMMTARVFESESSTGMVLLLELGDQPTPAMSPVDRGGRPGWWETNYGSVD
jgi:hypothetical protein